MDALSYMELKSLLKKFGRSATGTKIVLKERMQNLLKEENRDLVDVVREHFGDGKANSVINHKQEKSKDGMPEKELNTFSSGQKTLVSLGLRNEQFGVTGVGEGRRQSFAGAGNENLYTLDDELQKKRAPDYSFSSVGREADILPDYNYKLGPLDSVSQVSGGSRASVRSSASTSERKRLLKAEIAAEKFAEMHEKEIEKVRAKKEIIKRELEEQEQKSSRIMREQLETMKRLEEEKLATKQRLQDELEKIDSKIRKMGRQSRIAAAEMEFKVLEEGLEGNLDGLSGVSVRSVKLSGSVRPRVPVDAKPSIPLTGSQNVKIENVTQSKSVFETDLARSFMQCTLNSQLPKLEIERFDGNISKYSMFKAAFKSQIESKSMDDSMKIHYLYQYTSGRARRMVEACLNTEPSDGYLAAWKMIDDEYGNTEKIGAEYVNKLLARDTVRRDCAADLRDYHVELLMAKNAVEGIAYGRAELENPKTIKALVEKLPFHLQEKWRYKAVDLWQESHRSACFEDLLNLVERAANAANHPLYGKDYVGRSKREIGERREGKRVTVGVVNEIEMVCLCCEGRHQTYDCTAFQRMSLRERFNLIKFTRACYLCLQTGHQVRHCSSQERCEKCGRKHHVVLHADVEENVRGRRGTTQNNVRLNVGASVFRPRPNESAVNASSVMSTASGANSGSVAAVNVVVSRGNLKAKTAAFLDSGSAVSFCTQRLVNLLNSRGETSRVELTMTTMAGDKTVKCGLITGLLIRSVCGGPDVALPPLYVVKSLPISAGDMFNASELNRYDYLKGLNLEEINGEVDVMLGTNAVAACEPLEIKAAATPGDPYALKTRLGWVAYGGSKKGSHKVNVQRVTVKDRELNQLVEMAFNGGLEDIGDVGQGESVDDMEWREIVESGSRIVDGKYEIPLPLRKDNLKIPNSKGMALKRTLGLKKKLLKDSKFREEYEVFMNKMMNEGYMEECGDPEGEVWYIPHFGVKHPNKPSSVRVVFDCAAKVEGVSLNDLLLPGPDLNNKLIEVLFRFREGKWAYTADINSMFYQIRVPESDRNFLRFFWWDGGVLNGVMKEYRMTVHLFGACSSPSVATYALQRTTVDNGEFCEATKNTVLQNFYVDDCMKSSQCENSLLENHKDVVDLCLRGGFILSKLTTNCSLLVGNGKMREKDSEDKRALGVVWTAADDLRARDRSEIPCLDSRRRLLSFLVGIYDPIGIVAPLCLKGRRLIQLSFMQGRSWDEKFDDLLIQGVDEWVQALGKLNKQNVPRNLYASQGVVDLHIFSDASEYGHGAVAYIRTESLNDEPKLVFLWGKARVNPIKALSVPRLELIAATVAAKMKQKIEDSLQAKINSVNMWTDSMVVLRYLRNTRDRFETFVANRLTLIKSRTKVENWRYVDSSLNPADDASRGVQSKRWLAGPDFLITGNWPVEPVSTGEVDLETKKTKVLHITVAESGMDDLLSRWSSWRKTVRCIAWLRRFVMSFILKRKGDKVTCGELTLNECEEAEGCAIKYVQQKFFTDEINTLKRGQPVKRSSTLRNLDVFIGEGGFLRVRGRLQRLGVDAKVPIVLPRESLVVEAIIREKHQNLGHLGSATVLAELREKYWITRGHATVRSVLRKCVTCKKVQGRPLQQKMAELPEDRLKTDLPAFTCSGMDVFGPFTVKKRRQREKKYGLIFCCLTSRAIHLELMDDMTTDSTINAIRRFQARRSLVKKLRCDNGTNFVGAKNELEHAWNEVEIGKRVVNAGIEWEFNPPKASNFGGVWERLIRVVRRVLESIMGNACLVEDDLRTLFCEVEAIVNSRPLSVVSSDVRDLEVITPNKLLNLGESVGQCGEFGSNESDSRKRWRHVQHLAECFWNKWRKSYKNIIMERQKWWRERRNIQENDVVLLIDEGEARCHWPLGRVEEAVKSDDGIVRKVKILSKGKVILRPVSKIVVLLKSEDLY